MSKHVIELNSDNFESSVALSNKTAWVTFGASWCPPCKAFAPTHEEVAKSFQGRVLSFHVDIDNCSDLADKFEIKSEFEDFTEYFSSNEFTFKAII